ncbi:MAG: metal-dependent transcriptional regulator [Candidatus Eremiobacteraeota bacterium]|nr:metal-dependent transcriptional regulator [Candidatus Eremiobacteraeota bacterium]MBV8366335.1 metal-dependent transcriptional regulator [Candidatus Eremiobacteraeota bacterium]
MVDIDRDRSPERARQDYCKAILQEGEGKPVKPSDVARRLGVSRASVSKLAHELSRRGLIRDLGGGQLQLTAKGRKLGLDMVRRHRVVETFLHRALGVPLDRLHAEAERIEHSISDDVAQRLEHLLGHPQYDPHGDPIPGSGATTRRDAPLGQAQLGAKLRVTRILDRDRDAVRALARAGVLPGALIVLDAIDTRRAKLRVGRGRSTLTPAAASAVRVERVERDTRSARAGRSRAGKR